MKLRVSRELYERLLRAAEVSDLSMSNIARKACRKFNRLHSKVYVEVSKISQTSTYKGQELMLEIPESMLKGIGSSLLRNILAWYLDLHTVVIQRLYVPKNVKQEREIISYSKGI